jgi:hypothetical protein
MGRWLNSTTGIHDAEHFNRLKPCEQIFTRPQTKSKLRSVRCRAKRGVTRQRVGRKAIILLCKKSH